MMRLRAQRMGDDWMNYNMVCYIERDVFQTINDDDILYRFQAYKTRKGILPRRFGIFLSMTDSFTQSLCFYL